MELFYPRPDHPAYNPVAYPAPHSTFQYSRCTGRKRALCIGINYAGSDRPLRGCINDAIHVRDFLMKHHGFPSDQIMVLRDDSNNPRKIPTRSNMLAAMKWLVEGAQKHDSLFFHYSGHGGQTPDEDGDEIDGFDEVIYPVDYKRRGHILDDDMHRIMARPLPTGCRLTALFDSCHSGTVLDLPYVYTPSGRKRGVHVSGRALQRKATRADIISWSGCRDDQTSADTFQGGQPVGAMSYAFINSLRKNPHPTYQSLLKNLKALLYERFNQTPQLGSSHHIDTNLGFVV
ncbi:peptidase C14 [Marasmius fiardii PR-910]|nr:peptidase C14 [Marasmius fiardii PR-910]